MLFGAGLDLRFDIRELGRMMAKTSFQSGIPSLRPRDDSTIEWWFIQGRLTGIGVGIRHVMAAFFRVRGLDARGPPGTMLIQHTLDEETGEIWHDSRVTPETVVHHDRIAECVAAARFHPVLRDLVLWRHRADNAAWVRSNGVIIDRTGPEISGRPFSIGWNGFFLTKQDAKITLRIAVGSGVTATLTLSPKSKWLNERSERLHPKLGRAFAYQCCPRLHARGRAGTGPVEGRFWIDRQWGHFDGWLLASQRQGYRVLGWDWIGLSLDDGRDLLFCRHWDAVTKRVRNQWGVVFENGVPRRVETLFARPLRHWTSPKSGARYPVGWSLSLPDFGIQGTVLPVVEDQEIPVYGTTAIWEGAVQFSGTQGAKSVSGWGRLELVGYGAPLTVTDRLRRSVHRIATNLGGPIR